MKTTVTTALLTPAFAFIIGLLAASNAIAMSNAEAQQEIDNMLAAELTLPEVIVNLLEYRFSLAEATALTAQRLTDADQQQTLARSVLCMSRDLAEAEQITRAVAAMPGSDEQTVALFVNEQVKFSRSTCNEDSILERPPLTQSGGESRPALDTSPSR
ncbi:hypothetical protein EYC98_05830 [Halieaceae bacterium IMCC14734]|uniref:Uncharacterized protein n=1 Tax=Candidatus Litorirhabdus singularis TaxID=2518993 RepID=A0ABT3TEZ8_9GAMM|nr:hypothetical protein [Candidatus Litorirhabdus singularis]MCX2980390.1 hypothetical protein [Candidatus Litorirhabdus singularis]